MEVPWACNTKLLKYGKLFETREYNFEFAAKIEPTLGVNHRAKGASIHEKTRVKKSHAAVPLAYSKGALLLCPCLFHPSDKMWRSRRADAPWCTQFSTVISPSWITEQISVGKCAYRGASERREHQTSFKIVTWTKQTWTTHHNTKKTGSNKNADKFLPS